MSEQIWLCSFIDDTTGERWEFEMTSSPPMAQANAEVAGIKRLEAQRAGSRIRCTRSRFVKEI
jgi:hypothetical protein